MQAFLFAVRLGDLIPWNECELANVNKFFPPRVLVPTGLASQKHYPSSVRYYFSKVGFWKRGFTKKPNNLLHMVST